MRWYKGIMIFTIIFMLVGCNTNMNQTNNNDNNDIELSKISTNQVTDQHASNQAKEILDNYQDITKVRAANTSKILLVAIEIEHNKRFSLDETEQALKKKINKKFPDMDVVFSTDQKIILELEQLEKDIKANKISNKTLNKRIKHLVSLSKEQI